MALKVNDTEHNHDDLCQLVSRRSFNSPHVHKQEYLLGVRGRAGRNPPLTDAGTPLLGLAGTTVFVNP